MKISENRGREIIESFQGKKILVIGDIMIDEYLTGKVTRISPEAPVPVVEIDHEILCFGGAANVALNIKSLGCEPLLVGLVGKDRMAENFASLMSENHLNTKGLVESTSRPTTVKTRIIGDNQHIARVDKETINAANKKEELGLKQRIEFLITQADAVILQDYNKGVLTKELISYAIDLCIKYKLHVSVDPKFTNFKSYKNTTIFKPNIIEAQQAVAKNFENDEEVEEAGFELLNMLNAESVLLTRGKKGLSLFEKNNTVTHIPTQARKVADVSGAGDTVISTVTCSSIGGATKQEAAVLANIAAGIVVEEVGIVPIKKENLLANLSN
ncbi:MAG: D-glycero-beta-D-manno-heptose-7-phosphate kinase [Calditrichaeota bacterium]|nr:MAG: D-glycero-beta-D-manno-heptose-7-phosphate kinase [Calditrichota bacterium]MBL1204226.1 D-glycero-beta-D-manno-heptose-7-phosphate kinase [Calditrichota bacterium]NOG44056.1 D-glycero-beta-D-manno-heptose-7-phosphate kinase [Calditrichota bacterium]